jgi:L-aminopeptidase/D-esterase-like protein
VLYDLILAGPGQRPDAALGQAACAAAGREGERGNVGAGAGATVGKLFGDAGWMRGGVGTASLQLPGGVVMGALAVVNSFGDVVDPATGTILAGARRPGSGELVDTAVYAATAARLPERLEAWHTTLVGLATDADLPHGSLTLVTQAGHDGIAAAVRPSHTHLDGDTVFAVSTSGTERRVALLRILAAARRVTELAILDGVRSATSLEGLPALGDRGAR